MTLTDDQRQAILDEIVAISQRRCKRDFEFTRREYQERAEGTQAQAQWALDAMVDAGRLRREKAFVDGQWAYVYWRPEDEPDGTL